MCALALLTDGRREECPSSCFVGILLKLDFLPMSANLLGVERWLASTGPGSSWKALQF